MLPGDGKRVFRRDRKPVAAIAIKADRVALVLLALIVDGDDPRIRDNPARSRLPDPNPVPGERHQVVLDRTRVAEPRIPDGNTKGPDFHMGRIKEDSVERLHRPWLDAMPSRMVSPFASAFASAFSSS